MIAPAAEAAGLDPRVVQLVRSADREAAVELVRQPGLIPLVILRGSGETTRSLAAEAARSGVRTLAHADGGGVLYLDRAADPALATEIVTASLDRLGVCNRLNLLLIATQAWDELLGAILGPVRALGITPSLPPHAHPLGHEWALDSGHEATLTIAPADGPAAAAAWPTTARPASPPASSPPTPPRRVSSWTPTGGPARSGTPPPGCSTGSSSGGAGDRHQRGSCTRPARPGHVPGSVPPAVCRRACLARSGPSAGLTPWTSPTGPDRGP